jgi:hypothetical protein
MHAELLQQLHMHMRVGRDCDVHMCTICMLHGKVVLRRACTTSCHMLIATVRVLRGDFSFLEDALFRGDGD